MFFLKDDQLLDQAGLLPLGHQRDKTSHLWHAQATYLRLYDEAPVRWQ